MYIFFITSILSAFWNIVLGNNGIVEKGIWSILSSVNFFFWFGISKILVNYFFVYATLVAYKNIIKNKVCLEQINKDKQLRSKWSETILSMFDICNVSLYSVVLYWKFCNLIIFYFSWFLFLVSLHVTKLAVIFVTIYV